MSLEFFEYIRRANADWYTANPLEGLSEDQHTVLADRLGMTVDQLREHLTTPHVEMTCPLCGQASTHLVSCKGCGGDAWGWELQEAYGEDVHERLRQGYQAALTDIPTRDEVVLFQSAPPTVSQEQIQHATKHAYMWGGCHICPECWHHTLPVRAYETCPIKLLADQTLEPDTPPIGLFYILMSTRDEQQRRQTAREWFIGVWQHWTEVWNTLPNEQGRHAVAAWRHQLLSAAFPQHSPADTP